MRISRDCHRCSFQVSDRELCSDDSMRLSTRAKDAGVSVELEVWKGMQHCWHLFDRYVPEANAALEQIAEFVTKALQNPRHREEYKKVA